MITKDTRPPHSEPASYGVLENALDNAETLMKLLQSTVDKIDVTGQLKHKLINGYTHIELLAIPKTVPDILGEPLQTTEMHELLHKTIKDALWIKDSPPDYKWNSEHYHWKLTALKDESQWIIAQIWHTGPDYFINWLMSTRAHRKGALPWGYYTKSYNLFTNNNVSIAIQSESDFWKALGYLPIPLQDRHDGNPQYWRTFKRV